ncbi:unnamed protein product [Echinostoma caproni]|uniref:Chromo domain-containing protein n=1 Tax=Echinostoma caproni TaxID=27848 RepID=A0A183AR86_9TREM|nr:unnamed protein product [Echinostoma caproni]
MPSRRTLTNVEIEYEVEEIIDVRQTDGKLEFLIKWKGHSSEMNTWEPRSNLKCPIILRKFLAERGLLKETIVDVPDDIEPYGFDRGLAPECIVMVTKKDDELYFLLKWKGRSEFDVVPAAQANIRCPQLVIEFYEGLLHFK